MARPTVFDKAMLTKAARYLSDFNRADHGLIPSTAGLALHLNVARSTLYEWADKHPEFSDILERIQAHQEKELIAGGLGGAFNATITKLMLSKHGYVEKQEVTGKDGKDLFPSSVDQMTNEQLEAALKERGTS